MRLSLKDLLALVAFAAVIFWCVADMGYDNPMVWIAIVGAGIMAALWVSAARSQSARWLAPFAGAPVLPFMFCMMFASPALLVCAVLLFVVGWICAAAPRQSVRTLWALAMICVAASFVYGVNYVSPELQRLYAMREEWPVVSLADRLRYEHRADLSTEEATAASSQLAADVSAGLTKLELHPVGFDYNDRRWHLEKIHDRQYEQFVRASGFGVGRMLRPRPERIRRQPVLRDIYFDDPNPDEIPCKTLSPNRAVVTQTTPQTLHGFARNDFLSPSWFGAIVGFQQAAGFESHGMRYSLAPRLKETEAFKLERLELVSLLKFDKPQVYVLDHLPRMDQLSSDDMPTRPLDDFEQAALKKLWTEEDVVFEKHGDAYRMLGSLRAAKQCLDCHNVERGQLLGAFTYVLRRGEKGPLDSLQAKGERVLPGEVNQN